jgi:hypothetical protein
MICHFNQQKAIFGTSKITHCQYNCENTSVAISSSVFFLCLEFVCNVFWQILEMCFQLYLSGSDKLWCGVTQKAITVANILLC